MICILHEFRIIQDFKKDIFRDENAGLETEIISKNNSKGYDILTSFEIELKILYTTFLNDLNVDSISIQNLTHF